MLTALPTQDYTALARTCVDHWPKVIPSIGIARIAEDRAMFVRADEVID
jgi:hypothetical protein